MMVSTCSQLPKENPARNRPFSGSALPRSAASSSQTYQPRLLHNRGKVAPFNNAKRTDETVSSNSNSTTLSYASVVANKPKNKTVSLVAVSGQGNSYSSDKKSVLHDSSTESPSTSTSTSQGKGSGKRQLKMKAGLIKLDSPSALQNSNTPVRKRSRSKRSDIPPSSTRRPFVRSASVKSSTARRYDAPIEFSLSPAPSPYSSPPSNHPIIHQTELKGINENARIGKVRELPRTKRPTPLKRAILVERQMRRIKRSSSAPADSRSNTIEQNTTSGIDEKSVDQPSLSSLEHNMACPNSEQEKLVADLMNQLSQFQDRAFVKHAHAPHRRKRTKRFVCGLREVVKHLRLKHIRLVLIARDLEGRATMHCQELQTATSPNPDSTSQLSALEQILDKIWHLASSGDAEQRTPILITHTRRSLAKLTHKPSRVSIIGILSDAGAEQTMKSLLDLQSAINLPQPSSLASLESEMQVGITSHLVCGSS